MIRQKWTVAAKGMAVSAIVTFIFYGFAKLLVNPVAGGDEGYVHNANMYARNILFDWALYLGIYWIILAVFGKSSNILSKLSLFVLSIALLLNLYFVFNGIFAWHYWSCFEERLTHDGFDIRYLLECPTREIIYQGLIYSQLAIVGMAAIIGILHSKRGVI